MNLADERLKGLDNPSLASDERALIRCGIAADLIHSGQYEKAREALGDLWGGVGARPNLKGLAETMAAEVLLQCGSLTACLGTSKRIEGAQEAAKDLLSEANRGLTTACTRPRISVNVTVNLPPITLNARRVMPGVRRFTLRSSIVFDDDLAILHVIVIFIFARQCCFLAPTAYDGDAGFTERFAGPFFSVSNHVVPDAGGALL